LAHLIGQVYLAGVGCGNGLVGVGCCTQNGRPKKQCTNHVAACHRFFFLGFHAETLGVSKFILQLRTCQSGIARLDGLNDGW